jgi:hypothetical protein
MAEQTQPLHYSISEFLILVEQTYIPASERIRPTYVFHCLSICTFQRIRMGSVANTQSVKKEKDACW